METLVFNRMIRLYICIVLLFQTALFFIGTAEIVHCDATNYCDCDNNPSQGNTLACYEDEIVCTAGSPCTIDCGHQGCQRANIQCANGYECNVYCTEYYACSEAKIYGNAASRLSIYANATSSTHHIYNAKIYCPTGQSTCSVNCGNEYAGCYQTVIFGENTKILNVICGSDNGDICGELDIYCPSSGSCHIAGKPSTLTMRQMDIFALNGFNDVTITGAPTVDSIGRIHCEDSYTTSCVIDGNNINICDPSSTDKACDASPTTSPTTFSPTTMNPTTTYPTSAHPTSANPITSYPTTTNPTTNPTTLHPSTANPITAVPTTSHSTTSNPTTVPISSASTTTAPTNMSTTYSPTNKDKEGRSDETTSNGDIEETDDNVIVNDFVNDTWIYVVIALFAMLVIIICVVVLWRYKNRKEVQKIQLHFQTNQKVLSSSHINEKKYVVQMGQKKAVCLNGHGESKFEQNLVNNVVATNVMMDDVIDEMITPMHDINDEGVGDDEFVITNDIITNGQGNVEGTDSDDEIINHVNQYKTPSGVSNIGDDEFVIGSDTLQ